MTPWPPVSSPSRRRPDTGRPASSTPRSTLLHGPASSPADPGLHLTLAELYLDLGWRATAVEKLVLMGRLAELGDDAETRSRVCVVVAARLPDEPALAPLCA